MHIGGVIHFFFLAFCFNKYFFFSLVLWVFGYVGSGFKLMP